MKKRYSPCSRESGFTLIELMIVVGMLGVLASVAFSSYQDYVTQGRITKVNAHFVTATKFVRWHFASAQVRVSQGLNPNPAVPDTAAAWIPLLNPDAVLAPGGGDAYVTGTGDNDTGAIGIQVAGTWANFDSVVTITRPAFAGAPAASAQIVLTRL